MSKLSYEDKITREEKENAVIRVINGKSMCSVAVDIGLTSYIPLRKWIK